MAIVGIVYTSRATRLLKASELDHLLLDARTNNALTGITGVLLYGDGRFFQYFEGRENDVADVYARISRSSLHTDLVELERGQFDERLFRRWFMGFREAPGSMIQKLSQEHWAREIPWATDHAAHSPGMRQLLAFIEAASDNDR